MNSIVLMAELLTDPELRRTPDNQSSIASFLVQFAGSRAEEAPYRIKVVGWNNLADEIMANYHKGDQVVVEGRLRLDTIDRGTYKEKRTELIAQRVHGFAGGVSTSSATAAAPSSYKQSASNAAPANVPAASFSSPPSNVVPISTGYTPPASSTPDYDDIPF
ncbi:MAG: single-stranded DNA-binding protein [Oscillatoriales cyanobacterium CG2_30_44_21]|nr:MAG: single-stranded DNA-binding protein [Oscillatoriales cyanobacterium CG2_30_44_21]